MPPINVHGNVSYTPELEDQGPEQSDQMPRPSPLNIAVTEASHQQAQQAPLHDDLNSPDTPTSAFLKDYTSAENLPPGKLHESGNYMSFGSVQVPLYGVNAYQAVREHMIEGGAQPQKYLHAVENSSFKTEVHPYEPGTTSIPSLDGRFELADQEKGARPKTSVGEQTGNMYTTFGTKEGLLTETGNVLSPATVASHELAHAARLPQERKTQSKQNMGGPWTSSEEYHVIKGVETKVAEKHGEMARNSHVPALRVRTDSLTSTTPANPKTADILEDSKASLAKMSRMPMLQKRVTASMFENVRKSEADAT